MYKRQRRDSAVADGGKCGSAGTAKGTASADAKGDSAVADGGTGGSAGTAKGTASADAKGDSAVADGGNCGSAGTAKGTASADAKGDSAVADGDFTFYQQGNWDRLYQMLNIDQQTAVLETMFAGRDL